MYLFLFLVSCSLVSSTYLFFPVNSWGLSERQIEGNTGEMGEIRKIDGGDGEDRNSRSLVYIFGTSERSRDTVTDLLVDIIPRTYQWLITALSTLLRTPPSVEALLAEPGKAETRN